MKLASIQIACFTQTTTCSSFSLLPIFSIHAAELTYNYSVDIGNVIRDIPTPFYGFTFDFWKNEDSGGKWYPNASILTLNLSNSNLITLQCTSNGLISINLTGLTQLQELNCGFNLLTELVVYKEDEKTFCMKNDTE